MHNTTKTMALAGLLLIALALGLNAAVVLAGSHDAPNRETRQELARVRQSTAKYHKFEKGCADGFLRGSEYVPHMGLHFLNPAYIISDKEEFDVTTPSILLYVPRGNDNMNLVAVEYLAQADQIPDELFPGVGPEAWDPTPIPGIWGLHAWIWKGNPDGVFAPFNPTVPAEGPLVDCP